MTHRLRQTPSLLRLCVWLDGRRLQYLDYIEFSLAINGSLYLLFNVYTCDSPLTKQLIRNNTPRSQTCSYYLQRRDWKLFSLTTNYVHIVLSQFNKMASNQTLESITYLGQVTLCEAKTVILGATLPSVASHYHINVKHCGNIF